MSALTILLIDDDPNALRPMWSLLASHGCLVKRYVEGRRAAQEMVHRFDVVLEDGVEVDAVREAIRAIRADVIVLAGQELIEFHGLQDRRFSAIASAKTQPLPIC